MKEMKTHIGALISFVLLVLFCGLTIAQNNERNERGLTAQERRGKAIYMRGESPSGKEIKAIVGDMDLPASTVTCAATAASSAGAAARTATRCRRG